MEVHQGWKKTKQGREWRNAKENLEDYNWKTKGKRLYGALLQLKIERTKAQWRKKEVDSTEVHQGWKKNLKHGREWRNVKENVENY